MRDVFLVYRENGDVDLAFPTLTAAKAYVASKYGDGFLGNWEVVISDRDGARRWTRTLFGEASEGFEGPDIDIDRVRFISGDS